MKKIMKTRVIYIVLALMTIILGLLSRASFVGYEGFWIIYAIFPKIVKERLR